MVEIFTDISDTTKAGAEMIFNIASQLNPTKMAELLNNYTNACPENEQEFVRFYFNMRMRQIMHESDNDKR